MKCRHLDELTGAGVSFLPQVRQGTGKNRTQKLVIYYNFIGVLDMPEVEEYPDNVVLDSRQGVAVKYLVGKAG